MLNQDYTAVLNSSIVLFGVKPVFLFLFKFIISDAWRIVFRKIKKTPSKRHISEFSEEKQSQCNPCNFFAFSVSDFQLARVYMRSFELHKKNFYASGMTATTQASTASKLMRWHVFTRHTLFDEKSNFFCRRGSVMRA